MRQVIRGSIRSNIFRLVTTSVAVVLGVAFIAGTLTLKDSIGRSFDALFDQFGEDIDVVVRGQTAFAGPFFDAQRPDLDAALVQTIAAVPGVGGATGIVRGTGQFIDADGEPIGSAFRAPPLAQNWITDEALNPWTIDQGRAPAGPGEVIMDRATFRRHGFELGQPVEMIIAGAPRPFTLVGVARFGALDTAAGASVAQLDLATIQALLEKPGVVAQIDVASDGSVDQATLAQRVTQALSGTTQAEVVTGEDATAAAQKAFSDALDNIGTVLLIIGIVALVVGVYTIANTFSIIVAQRSRELALLRAIGARRSQVIGAVMMEAIVVGLIGSVFGIVGGYLLAGAATSILYSRSFGEGGASVRLTAPTIVVAVVVGVIVTFVSALWPAWKASRVPPIAALREVAVDDSSRSPWRIALGAVVTSLGVALLVVGLFGDLEYGLQSVGVGVGLTFLGVTILGPVLARPAARLLGWPLPRLRGITGDLARENAMRNPTRTASTAAALMIGVALVTLLSVFLSSLRTQIDTTVGETFRGDVTVDTGSFGLGGVSPQLATDIGALPETGAVTGLRFGVAQVAGQGAFVVGVEPAPAAEILDLGVVAGDLASLDPASIAISDGWVDEMGLSLGDPVPVTFVETGSQLMTLKAIFTERDLLGDFVISTAASDANFPTSLDAQVYVKAAPGVSADQLATAVATAAESYPNARVQSRAEFIEDQTAQFDLILLLFTALLSFAILIALFGITNTLALSVLERTHELGLLRAVGMTRSQVRASVRWESVIISLFGTALGLTIGVFFARVLISALEDEGFTAFTLPIGQLAGVFVVAAVAGVLTGLLPAWRASRVDVLAAIASS